MAYLIPKVWFYYIKNVYFPNIQAATTIISFKIRGVHKLDNVVK